MLKSQEIQLAQSKRRERMAEIQKADEISDEGRTELRSLTDSYQNAEVELRTALVLEDAERDKIAEPDKAQNDFDRECRQFSLADAVASMTEGKPLSGREAEVSAELEQRDGTASKGTRVPWDALSTRDDAIVTAPDASSGELASRPTMKALERLFEDSAAQRFGFQSIQVTGQPRFPSLDDGASASWVAEGSGTDAAAITTSVQEPALHTLTSRYLLSRQATRQNPVLETMLRRDLSEVMREALDKACFQGSGSGDEPAGLEAILTSPTDHGNSVMAYGSIVNWATDMMTSAKLSSFDGISIAGVPANLKSLLTTTFGDVLTEFEQAQKLVKAMTFSSQVSDTAGDVNNVYVGAPRGHAWHVAWGSPQLLVDPYSESKTGKIALTVFAFTDILVQRQASHFKRISNVSIA
ncbi:MAG: phage major capsid protein [Roseovarius pacificus]|nr:phage major capsid protein [Roseovarius pacificus]